MSDGKLVKVVMSYRVPKARSGGAGPGYEQPDISGHPHGLSAPAGRRWFVVHSQPHRELRAQTHLAAQGYHTFLPRYRKTVRHARKLTTVNAAFFERYLFVALDLASERWRSINGTFGVTCLVSHRTSPIAVPHGIVESLIDACDADGFINPGGALRIGERVRVLTGPFAGLVGKLVRLDGARRVQVLLGLLGGAVAVSIDRAHLVSVAAA